MSRPFCWIMGVLQPTKAACAFSEIHTWGAQSLNMWPWSRCLFLPNLNFSYVHFNWSRYVYAWIGSGSKAVLKFFLSRSFSPPVIFGRREFVSVPPWYFPVLIMCFCLCSEHCWLHWWSEPKFPLEFSLLLKGAEKRRRELYLPVIFPTLEVLVISDKTPSPILCARSSGGGTSLVVQWLRVCLPVQGT